MSRLKGNIVFSITIGVLAGALLYTVFSNLALGQETLIDPADPQSWIVNPWAIVMAANVITGYIVNFFTSYFKDVIKTEGKQTILLSLVVALVISAVVGFKGLGGFVDYGGLAGAWNVALMTIWAFIQSNGMAKGQRQALGRR